MRGRSVPGRSVCGRNHRPEKYVGAEQCVGAVCVGAQLLCLKHAVLDVSLIMGLNIGETDSLKVFLHYFISNS